MILVDVSQLLLLIGLLPIAVAGIDIDELMKGLHDGMGRIW